jgi:hypothetical protein
VARFAGGGQMRVYLDDEVYQILLRDQRKLKIADKALRYYAQGEELSGSEPGVLNEFGCGCCAGVNDAEGMSSYDKSVIGSTARDALAEMEKV